ncbi:RNA 2',3'-cyclic phosphodiesterase [Amycolatopsis jejuensis]|uniref:RNA 2',3'-cyclic phosphodiesterase n=1 Tax=Amycolatopsis jejuensis TaxID=330084 RepID=UPI000526C579|nr:RNA 2',3'-cyclic phosphodiesterase [Amycolatopsis jejuensis]
MRLFSALVPPADVVAEVAAALGDRDDALRWSAPEDWHVTLAFYGEADLAERTAFLTEALDGRPPIDLRLAGAGTFPGVLWLGVTGEGLAELAEAAGAQEYRAHVTLARYSREHPGLAKRWEKRLTGFESRSWTADEVVLMRGGRPYRTLATRSLHRA